jgi:hypothetical protein
MSSRLHYGLFASSSGLMGAARECRDRGLVVVDALTPYPVHGLDEAMGIRRSRLPWVTLSAGATGLALALWFQYWSSSADWPLNVGGKPFDSLPAFMPVAFEMLILFAGLATAAALFIRSGLRPGGAPRSDADEQNLSRVTDDRFVLIVERRDASLREQQIEEVWQRHGAVNTWTETRP